MEGLAVSVYVFAYHHIRHLAPAQWDGLITERAHRNPNILQMGSNIVQPVLPSFPFSSPELSAGSNSLSTGPQEGCQKGLHGRSLSRWYKG